MYEPRYLSEKDPQINLDRKSFLNRVNRELKGYISILCTANDKNKNVICSLFLPYILK